MSQMVKCQCVPRIPTPFVERRVSPLGRGAHKPHATVENSSGEAGKAACRAKLVLLRARGPSLPAFGKEDRPSLFPWLSGCFLGCISGRMDLSIRHPRGRAGHSSTFLLVPVATESNHHCFSPIILAPVATARGSKCSPEETSPSLLKSVRWLGVVLHSQHPSFFPRPSRPLSLLPLLTNVWSQGSPF